MDYVTPGAVVADLLAAAEAKAALRRGDLVLRGALSGAILGIATAVAFSAAVQTGSALVGALVFPFGLALIVLLGLELLTGSFGVIPLGVRAGRVAVGAMLANWLWVLVGNLLGAVLFGVLLALALTNGGSAHDATGLTAKIVAAATAKTLGYAHAGAAGWIAAFVKGALCNWMVCLAVVLGFASRSTAGKVIGAWLPVFAFFFLGFEHLVVNLFVIPTGMLLGAHVGVGDWLLWNAIPVALGNLVGGYAFTTLALAVTYGERAAPAHDGALLTAA